MTNGEHIEFVRRHAVARICMGVGNSADWQRVTPDQFRMIERRLEEAGVEDDHLARIVDQARKMANPAGSLPDEELTSILSDPVLHMLLGSSAWERDYQRTAERWAVIGAEAKHIDPATAEILSHYGDYFDTYGLGSNCPEVSMMRLYFARRPGSDICVYFDDLPAAVRQALLKRIDAEPPEDADSLPF